jgi:integrase
VEKILAAAEERYRTVYWLAVETGMRCGELCALRIEDVNLEAGAIRVSRAVWRGQLQSPKSLASSGACNFARAVDSP